MASRETLQKLIQFGNAEQFATHAEDWSACSSAAILNAAVEQLGKLTQQRAYKDNARPAPPPFPGYSPRLAATTVLFATATPLQLSALTISEGVSGRPGE